MYWLVWAPLHSDFFSLYKVLSHRAKTQSKAIHHNKSVLCSFVFSLLLLPSVSIVNSITTRNVIEKMQPKFCTSLKILILHSVKWKSGYMQIWILCTGIFYMFWATVYQKISSSLLFYYNYQKILFSSQHH